MLYWWKNLFITRIYSTKVFFFFFVRRKKFWPTQKKSFDRFNSNLLMALAVLMKKLDCFLKF
jgi:hypothetical protein